MVLCGLGLPGRCWPGLTRLCRAGCFVRSFPWGTTAPALHAWMGEEAGSELWALRAPPVRVATFDARTADIASTGEGLVVVATSSSALVLTWYAVTPDGLGFLQQQRLPGVDTSLTPRLISTPHDSATGTAGPLLVLLRDSSRSVLWEVSERGVSERLDVAGTILGPVTSDGQTLVVVDGQLNRLTPEGLEVLDDRRYSCLGEGPAGVFVCALRQVFRVGPDGRPTELIFNLIETRSPVLTAVPADRRQACLNQWFDLAAEAGLAPEVTEDTAEAYASTGGCTGVESAGGPMPWRR